MANEDFDKQEWQEWKDNPVTQKLFMYIEDEINQETWSLIENAGSDTVVDAKSGSKIMALGQVLNWKPTEFAENIDEIVMVDEASVEETDEDA